MGGSGRESVHDTTCDPLVEQNRCQVGPQFSSPSFSTMAAAKPRLWRERLRSGSFPRGRVFRLHPSLHKEDTMANEVRDCPKQGVV